MGSAANGNSKVQQVGSKSTEEVPRKMAKGTRIAKELDSKHKAKVSQESKPFVGVLILGKSLSLDFPNTHQRLESSFPVSQTHLGHHLMDLPPASK